MSIITKPYMTAKSLHSYNPISGGCVGYWPLWNPNLSGPVFKSIDPYGHLATVTGATWGITGRTFDGTDDYINVPDKDVFSFTDGAGTDKPFTIIVWQNVTNYNSNRMLLCKANSGTVLEWSYQIITAGNLQIALYNDGGTTNTIGQKSDATITGVGRYLCLGATYTGSKLSSGLILYQDGQVFASSVTEGGTYTGMSNTVSPLQVGAVFTTLLSDYLGVMGEIWIYNRALSAGEIAHIYNQTKWRYA